MAAFAITSPQNPRVKAAVRLRDAPARRETGTFLFEGDRELTRALDAGLACQQAFYLPTACQTATRRELLARLARAGCELLETTDRVFEKLAFGQRQAGIVVVAAAPQRTLADLALPGSACVAVLEGVEKPGNLGAVLRSADAAGVSAVICVNARTDLFNHHTVRNSLGTIFCVPACAAASDEALDWLVQRQFHIYAARVDAPCDYTQADLTGPAAIVLGSEAQGLSDAWRGAEVTPIGLPMLGAADSLNVSAAAAVLFYEALRQRRAVDRSSPSA